MKARLATGTPHLWDIPHCGSSEDRCCRGQAVHHGQRPAGTAGDRPHRERQGYGGAEREPRSLRIHGAQSRLRDSWPDRCEDYRRHLRRYNIPADQDQDEATDPNTADVRALDSFNPREKLLEYINTYGVTTVQAAPGISNPIAGQAGIFKTVGPKTIGLTADQLAVRPVSAIVFNLGESPKRVYGKENKPPTTRMMIAAIIRKALVDAQSYQKKWADWNASEKKDPTKQPARDLKLEAVSRALRGEIPAIFNAYRADDIDTAIRLAQEFKLKFMLSSVSEGYLEAQVIKQSGAPALVGPTLQRLDSLETENASLENAAILVQAGVPVALMTGFENYVPKNRVLLFEAAVAAANGLGFEGALRACTIESAKILGIADRVGSLEVGKDADVVLYDADPFEYTSHVTAVLVNGKVSYQRQ